MLLLRDLTQILFLRSFLRHGKADKIAYFSMSVVNHQKDEHRIPTQFHNALLCCLHTFVEDGPPMCVNLAWILSKRHKFLLMINFTSHFGLDQVNT